MHTFHNFTPSSIRHIFESLVLKLREVVREKHIMQLLRVPNAIIPDTMNVRLHISDNFLYCFIFDIQGKERISIPIVTEEDMNVLFKGMSLFDYVILSDYALQQTLLYWEDLLESSSTEELQSAFDDMHTKREAYEQKIAHTKEFQSNFSQYICIGEHLHFMDIALEDEFSTRLPCGTD